MTWLWISKRMETGHWRSAANELRGLPGKWQKCAISHLRPLTTPLPSRALWLTHTTLNIVSFLGAIIGVGIVAKNGILMLDFVGHLRAEGASLEDALVRSGHRRLRPVLMTSLAAAFGMLPLAYGIGSGADMLKPLAIAVIGALCISVLLSLVATPTVYYVMRYRSNRPA